ncbi:MAG: hypothetical protein ACRDYB_10020 [Acidimicrobiales bacterium]
MSARPAGELCAGYEALRAAAAGSVVSEMPRGLALFIEQGLPAWMRAFCALAPPPPIVPVGERPPVSGLGADVVRLLTEMALGCRTTLASS